MFRFNVFHLNINQIPIEFAQCQSLRCRSGGRNQTEPKAATESQRFAIVRGRQIMKVQLKGTTLSDCVNRVTRA